MPTSLMMDLAVRSGGQVQTGGAEAVEAPSLETMLKAKYPNIHYHVFTLFPPLKQPHQKFCGADGTAIHTEFHHQPPFRCGFLGKFHIFFMTFHALFPKAAF